MGRIEQKGGVADGGLDLIVHGRDGKTGVECKHQPNTSVGRPVVQKLHSALITHRLAGGMVITTGRYTAEARECARKISRKIPIELLDMGRLAEMAQRAGIRLEAWEGDSAALCLPATDAAGLRAMLSKLLAPVESHPAPAAELLEMTPTSLRLEAHYVVTSDVDQDFTTSAGLIHSVHVHGIHDVLSAKDSSAMDPAQASFLLKGAQLIEPSRIPAVACPVVRERSAVNKTSAKRIVTERLIREHSSEVSYTGQNGVSYKKVCKIGSRSVQITDFKKVWLPKYQLSLKFLKNAYECTLVQNGSEARITESNMYECGVCGKDAGKAALLCNSCGAMAHAPKPFGPHSHRCKDCGKTICRNCAFWVKGVLVFKKMLCGQCAGRRPGAKRA